MGNVKFPYAGQERMGTRDTRTTVRSGRFEIRTTPTIREQVEAVAKQQRRTLTSLLDEAIEDVIKKYPVSPVPSADREGK